MNGNFILLQVRLYVGNETRSVEIEEGEPLPQWFMDALSDWWHFDKAFPESCGAWDPYNRCTCNRDE